MRIHRTGPQTGLALLAFCSLAASQTSAKTLRFTHTPNETNMMEIATTLRAIAGVTLTMDRDAKTVTVSGAAANLEAAAWVFNELDRPPGATVPDGMRIYKMPDEHGEGTIRVFHLTHTPTVESLQEIATCVRAVTETKRLFTYSDPRVIVLRGTGEQASAAEWVVQQLDQPARQAFSVLREQPLPDPTREGLIQIFYPLNATTVQQLQEMATCTRALIEIRRLFTYNLKRAIIVRGTAPQLQLADWLLHELDKKPQQSFAQSGDYVMNGDPREGLVKVFFAAHLTSPKQLQELATEVRTTTAVRRIFTYNAPKAIAVRGSANQIARAGELIAASAKP